VSSDGPIRVIPRPLLLGALLLVVLVVLTVSGQNLWRSHQRASLQHAYSEAERTLTTLRLPAVLSRGTSARCTEAPGVLCATSTLTGTRVDRLMSEVMHSDSRCSGGYQDSCRPILGTVAGYPAAAIVTDHFVRVATGRPPAGAAPIGPRRNHVFTIGTYIEIQIDAPSS
jgi:hypothetical protein